MNMIPKILLEKYLEVNIISFTNVCFSTALFDWIAQVSIIKYKHWCRKTCTRNGLWYRLYPSASDLLENTMCPVVNQQSALRQRRVDRKGMKGQQGGRPGTEKGIVFALSVFAQFSAGQILASVLGSRSSLLGFNLTPCPQRLNGKKKRTGRGRKEDQMMEGDKESKRK